MLTAKKNEKKNCKLKFTQVDRQPMGKIRSERDHTRVIDSRYIEVF